MLKTNLANVSESQRKGNVMRLDKNKGSPQGPPGSPKGPHKSNYYQGSLARRGLFASSLLWGRAVMRKQGSVPPPDGKVRLHDDLVHGRYLHTRWVVRATLCFLRLLCILCRRSACTCTCAKLCIWTCTSCRRCWRYKDCTHTTCARDVCTWVSHGMGGLQLVLGMEYF